MLCKIWNSNITAMSITFSIKGDTKNYIKNYFDMATRNKNIADAKHLLYAYHSYNFLIGNG